MHFWDRFLDVTTVIAALATVAAAWLAWIAIKRGNRQAAASMQALQRERRLDFEIPQLMNVLAELQKGNAPQWTTPIADALELLPPDDVNLLGVRAQFLNENNARRAERDAIWAAGTARGMTATSHIAMDRELTAGGELSYREMLIEDVRAAIRARLDERE